MKLQALNIFVRWRDIMQMKRQQLVGTFLQKINHTLKDLFKQYLYLLSLSFPSLRQLLPTCSLSLFLHKSFLRIKFGKKHAIKPS